MSVVISKAKPLVECPATLFIPADGGGFEKHEFTVIFKRLSKEVRDDLNERFIKGDIKNGQLLDEVVHGWGGMLDADGQPVPYSSAERMATENAFPGTEEAMCVSWFDHFFVHQRAAAEKNSKALSSTTSGSTAQTATS